MTKHIVRILQSNNMLRSLTDEERRTGEQVHQTSLQTKRGESVLIVADRYKLQEASIFFETAKLFTPHVTFIEIAPLSENAQEPPKDVARLMCQSNICFLVTEMSMSHTKARMAANDAGTRIASLPGITYDIMMHAFGVDYDSMKRETEALASILTKGKQVHITSLAGTQLQLSLEKRHAHADTGILTKPGDVGNLPAGEAFIAPVEGSANGIAVFDGSFDSVELDKPMTVVIKKGKAVKITGGRAAKTVQKRMEAVGEKARWVCELGVGTNPTARLSSNLLEGEKVYGTCHIAFGNNATFGGTIDTPFHSDGVMKKPTMIIDGKIILKEGMFTQ